MHFKKAFKGREGEWIGAFLESANSFSLILTALTLRDQVTKEVPGRKVRMPTLEPTANNGGLS